MNFIKIVAVTFICCLICVLVKHIKPELLPVVQLSSIVTGFVLIMSELEQLLKSFSEMISKSNIVYEEYIFMLLKVLGITLLTKFASEMCKDSGNSALAVNVEFAGKVVVMMLCFPLFRTIVELTTGLLK